MRAVRTRSVHTGRRLAQPTTRVGLPRPPPATRAMRESTTCAPGDARRGGVRAMHSRQAGAAGVACRRGDGSQSNMVRRGMHRPYHSCIRTHVLLQ